MTRLIKFIDQQDWCPWHKDQTCSGSVHPSDAGDRAAIHKSIQTHNNAWIQSQKSKKQAAGLILTTNEWWPLLKRILVMGRAGLEGSSTPGMEETSWHIPSNITTSDTRYSIQTRESWESADRVWKSPKKAESTAWRFEPERWRLRALDKLKTNTWLAFLELLTEPKRINVRIIIISQEPPPPVTDPPETGAYTDRSPSGLQIIIVIIIIITPRARHELILLLLLL